MRHDRLRFLLWLVASSLVLFVSLRVEADDWPMLGRDSTRNAVSRELNPPTYWRVTDARGRLLPRDQRSENIKWASRLGFRTVGDPVVANGLVWIGTNAASLDEPTHRDASVLMCFREADGELLYKYVSPRLPQGRVHDASLAAMACSPHVEGDRIWFVTNRCETVCLDIGPLQRGEGDPRLVWKKDMMSELDVFPRGDVMNFHRWCSIASYQSWIYVITNNGVGSDRVRVPKPHAPSLVCFQKHTGDVVWEDNSPGRNILYGQWASPTVIEVNRQVQVIVPQGDGWVRAFEPAGDGNGNSRLIWEFDMNPKESHFRSLGARGTRNYLMTPAVFHNDLLYLATGRVPEFGEVLGRLCCIDPAGTGDVSAELAVDANDRPIPHRREQAVDRTKGETTIANPASRMRWEFIRRGEDFEDEMHGTLSSVVVHDDLAIVADFAGLVHCLDASTGKKHWSYDMWASIFSSPLIVNKRVYVTDQDGDVAVFRLSADPKKAMFGGQPVATINVGDFVQSSPVFANGVLYVARMDTLLAIQGGDVARSDQVSSGAVRAGKRPLRRAPDAPFVPTPNDVVERMLTLAGVTENDVVYDLGSGDGRIVIAAAKRYGCRAVGIEIDPQLVQVSLDNVRQQKVQSLVRIEHQDVFTSDLSEATVISVFLYPRLLKQLMPQFEQLKPGSRIVSNHFEIPGIHPDRVIEVRSREEGGEHKLMLWTTPLNK